ncbi:MAG: ABC transporter ATP-binding protein/permease [Tabrizicola sp.]|jgi:ABC-type multidrug transport system fused ATPase/permease subunit|nr:ABC transporter ATP-binding protein/permease [Tabrizicola sp.]
MIVVYRQIFDLLDQAERRQFYILLALVILMALIDLIGVAAVLPFLAVAADPARIHENELLRWLYEASGVTTEAGFILLLGVLVFSFILFGLSVKLISQYRIIRFSHLRNHSLSRGLLRRYLAQPYVWFLGQNSADLGAAILAECDKVVGYALIPAMRVLANFVSLVFLIGLLVAISPIVAAVAALGVGGAYAVIFLFVRHRLGVLGDDLVAANAARHRMALEAFGGIKDVKLLHLEGRYAERYDGPSLLFAESSASSQVIGELPRFLLEAVAFGGLVLMILALLVLQDGRLADILPILGVFGFAVLKIFPSVQQIYHSLTLIRFISPMLTKLHRDLTGGALPAAAGPYAPFATPLPLNEKLELRDVQFSYPGGATPTLQGLTLTIPALSTVGFVGGTGAGKTTAIDIILGLLVPDQGTVVVDGQTLTAESRRAWQRSIGYVPQQIFLIDDSLAANIAFGIPPEQIDRAAVERAARLAELHDFITTDLPQGYDTIVGERGVRLSGGQRQRIGIARALYHDPGILIFDEATSALDNVTERAVIEAVRNIGHAKTIIMIAHRLTTVRDCDTIFLLEAGRLAAEGDFETLVANNAAFRKMAS